MNDADRFRLRFGPYRTPRFQYGKTVWCEVRGEVRIVGLSDALIPWTMGRKGNGRPALVVYGDLAKAVRRESNLAVAHHWGVTGQTVTRWRKALDVDPINEGTFALLSDYGEERIEDALPAAHAKARDPERCRKIAEAQHGRRRPPHTIEAMRRGRTGKLHTEETRRKMSAAQKARGAWPPAAGDPWSPAEDELVRTLPAPEVARRTGRLLAAVYSRRSELKVPDGRRQNGRRRGER
jgi:hypothetical protein